MFAILVIDADGNDSYVCDNLGDTPTRYTSKSSAQSFVDFMRIGMDGDVQSINVVPYPKKRRTA
jgi:hypothetical protein